MEVFVLRHGEAAPSRGRDRDRELTPRGREQVAANIQLSLADLDRVQALWVSPYIRAQQTAVIAHQYFPKASLRTTELLEPGADICRLCQSLEAAEESSVMLVSHQPLVGTLVNWLCGFPGGHHNMSTASLACIDAEILASDLGELRWLRHPTV